MDHGCNPLMKPEIIKLGMCQNSNLWSTLYIVLIKLYFHKFLPPVSCFYQLFLTAPLLHPQTHQHMCTIVCTLMYIHAKGEERSDLGPAWGVSADGERGRGLWHGSLHHTHTHTHTHRQALKLAGWHCVCVSAGPAVRSDTIALFGKEIQTGTSRCGNAATGSSRFPGLLVRKHPQKLLSNYW